MQQVSRFLLYIHLKIQLYLPEGSTDKVRSPPLSRHSTLAPCRQIQQMKKSSDCLCTQELLIQGCPGKKSLIPKRKITIFEQATNLKPSNDCATQNCPASVSPRKVFGPLFFSLFRKTKKTCFYHYNRISDFIPKWLPCLSQVNFRDTNVLFSERKHIFLE